MGLLATPGSLAGAVLAATEGSLVFPDDRPLNLTWNQVDRGAFAATICNMGSSATPPVDVRSIGFTFRNAYDKTYVADDAMLSGPYPQAFVLDPLTCTTVHVTVATNTVTDQYGEDHIYESGPPAPGVYAGMLVVASEDAALLQKPVIISVPTIGAVTGTTSVRATRFWPCALIPPPLDAVFRCGSWTVQTPVALNSGDTSIGDLLSRVSTERGVLSQEPLGFLTNGSDFAVVRLNWPWPSPDRDGVVYAPISVERVENIGSYTGDTSLGAGFGTIKLSLTATDDLWFPVAAMRLGAAAGVIVALQLATRSGRD